MEIAIEYGHEEEQTQRNQEVLRARCCGVWLVVGWIGKVIGGHGDQE